jgi:hypothetical protein
VHAVLPAGTGEWAPCARTPLGFLPTRTHVMLWLLRGAISPASRTRGKVTFSREPPGILGGAQNVEHLRVAIDSGSTKDKVAVIDPAAAPLGSDAEAAGFMTSRGSK